ncbi:MAG: hypothetical protein LQ338_005633 [Usnochroma carphineum]|nr:MAG: hypothetical protein LQ338_005633 [Usnochroma carphineum]
MAAKFGTLSHLLPPNYKRMITDWLEEDCPSFDYGGFVVGEEVKEARLLGKSPGMLAGVPFFDEVFRQLDCSVEWHIHEGETFEPVKHCATVRGPIRKILLGERVALNTLARCSGIATKTSSLLHLLQTTTPSHTNPPPTLAGTRKTTPGFRLPEKYALAVGGADTHRHDLSAMTMLKDNHIWACGGDVARAVHAAKSAGGFAVKVEVECRSEDEAVEAVKAGADVVMLDNFVPGGGELRGVVRRLRRRFKGDGGFIDEEGEGEGEGKGKGRMVGAEERREFLIEVSGGLTEENVRGFVVEGVDVISTSSIHQGVKHVDFSLKVVH